MFNTSEFKMFVVNNPEAALRMVRMLVFAALVLLSLALPGVAFAEPLGGDIGS